MRDLEFRPMVWPRLAPVRLFLCGLSGSGKGLVAEHLAQEEGFHRVSLGALCAAEAERQCWALDRVNLQAAGDVLRRDDLAALARRALESPTPTDVSGVVVDGVRLPAEADLLRRAGYLGIGVSASEWTRARRLKARGERWPVPDHYSEIMAGEVRIDYLLPSDDMEDPGLLLVRVARMLRWARARASQGR